jgi:zinc protease
MKKTSIKKSEMSLWSQKHELGHSGFLGLCLAFSLGALALVPAALQAQQAKPWEQIPIPKLHEFKPHQPKRIELKNGIVLFLQEDHELPFVSGSVLIPGGERDEDPAKTGLVGLGARAALPN